MNSKKIAKLWQKSANDDWKASQELFKTKHYPQCLFFLHLSIEKMLKALILLETKKQAPYIHQLNRLAVLANLSLSEIDKNLLDEITTFNTRGRYSANLTDFIKKCTKMYTLKYLASGKKLFICFKKIISQKISGK